MSEELRRLTRQEADLDQTNDQKVDQANTQDASHHSEARQRVAVTVENHMSPPAYGMADGRLAGLILDNDGQGIPGVTVELFFGPMVGVPVAIEQTDALGGFRVDGLPGGFYSVRAGRRDRATVQHWNVRVDQGRESRIQLALPSFLPSPRRKSAGSIDAPHAPIVP